MAIDHREVAAILAHVATFAARVREEEDRLASAKEKLRLECERASKAGAHRSVIAAVCGEPYGGW